MCVGRFSATSDLDFRFEKQIQLASKRALGSARTFGHGLDAAEDSVHHETIRLVSLNFRLRKRIAGVLSTTAN